MKQDSVSSQQRLLVKILIFLCLLRVLSLGLYPLADTTEARYAEIARLMFSAGDWITPQIDAGVPFWGKPPLSIWLSAISFQLFGVNEFAARLPSFLLGVMVVSLIYAWAKQLRGTGYALAAATILTTSAVFFISSGAVMTDPALLLGTTLSMVAFYRAMTQQMQAGHLWGYLFFIGLAISLLAKGPVGLVLTLVPTGGWVLWQRRWKDCWQKLPWCKGLLLALALGLPWYLLAERETPGFLEYFLVGEHWKRFIEPGWKGDLYGSAHSRTVGTIWVYWLVSVLPWSLIVVWTLFNAKCRRQAALDLKKSQALSSYLLLWCLTPMLFFTLAGNILYTYVLPGIPAFSLLMAQLWNLPENASELDLLNRPIIFSRVAIGMAILLTVTLLITTSDLVPKRKCQKGLITTYERFRQPNARLIYFFKRPHSAQFYSRGSALEFKNPQDAEMFLEDEYEDFFVIRTKHIPKLPDRFTAKLENLGEQNHYSLLRERLE
ncbi:MAG: glycosyltransferase family 39 protein [Desulfuromusa sp.]|jgi:4-amino-4-deoxy-L-arabinose transferase-like glycosyltransferase|nr:glycosyltransferase family 39 protein [Desulfuromusa sp.]